MKINYQTQIQNGITELNLKLSEETQRQMLEFLYFLQKWNKNFNLTAITDMEKMITHHLLDSLSIVPYVNGSYILDMGTGAGLPGVPLAFYFPEKNFVLLDSNAKKVSFLIQAKQQFNLRNITPIHSRVEDYSTEKCFEVIITRAVGSINEIIRASKHLCCQDGNFLFMKGKIPEEELENINLPCSIYPLKIPQLPAERHAIIIKPGPE